MLYIGGNNWSEIIGLFSVVENEGSDFFIEIEGVKEKGKSGETVEL